MGKATTIAAVLLCGALSSPAAAQLRLRGGEFYMFLATPKASMAETQDQGLGGGLAGSWFVGSEFPFLQVSATMTSFSGRTRWVQGVPTHYDRRYLATLSIGPRFQDARGLYIVPALALSFGSIYDRPERVQKQPALGLECSAGTSLRVVSGLRIVIGLNLGMMNLLSQSIPEAWDEGVDLEQLVNVVGLCAGIHF